MMKSYTLLNWDGSLENSVEKLPETPSNGLTGASTVVAPNPQYDSSYGGHSGNGNGHTTYRHERWVGTESQHSIRDASSHEEPITKAKPFEHLPIPHKIDGSILDSITSTTGKGRDEDAHSNIFHSHDGGDALNPILSIIQRSNGLQHTSESSAHGVATNLEHYNTEKNLDQSPHLLPLSSFASLTPEPTNRLFVPDLTSPLHTFHPILVAKRKLEGIPDPFDRPPKRIVTTARPKIPQTDIISVHTADAEGEEDDMLVTNDSMDSVSRQRSVHSRRSDASDRDSLFTPAPSPDVYIAVESLFTPPPPSSAPPRPAKTFLRMSHVEVPPFKRPRTDYKPMRRPNKPKDRTQVKAVSAVNDLARALQAAYDHNEGLGTFPLRPKKVQRKRKVEPKMSSTDSSQHRTESIVASGFSLVRQKPKNTVTVVEGVNRIPANRVRNADIIDLTSVDYSERQAKVTPSIRLPTRPENPAVQSRLCPVYIGAITPTPQDATANNIHFIRRYIHNLHQSDIQAEGERHRLQSTKSNYSRRALVHSVSTSNEPEEFSLGALLVYADEFGAVSEDIHNPPLIVPLQKKPSSAKHLAETTRPLPKINLAVKVKSHKPKWQIVPETNPPPVNVPPSYGPGYNHINTAPYVSANFSQNTIYVTPNLPSSLSISSISHPQPQTSTYTSIDQSEVPTPPSLKALGKRKADTPPLISDPASVTQYALPRYLDTPQMYTSQLQRTNGNLEIFLHPYTPSQPSLGTSSNTAQDLLKTGLSSLYPSAMSTGMGSFLGDSGDHFHQPNVFDPWNEYTNHSLPTYEYSTVDPALLGGEPINVDPLEGNFEMEPEVTTGAQPMLLDDTLETISSRSSSPQRSPSAIDNQRKSSPTPAYSPGTTASEAHLLSPTASDFEVFQQRRHPPRKLSGTSDATKVVPFSDDVISECRSSPSPLASSDDSESDIIVVARKKTGPPQATISRISNLTFLTASATLEHGPWPVCKEENIKYCHQCRRKTRYLLMHCGACSLHFCSYCLLRRYPDIDFDLTTEQPSCPRCGGYCNCTQCCSKRGDVYVSGEVRLPVVRPSGDIPYWGTVYNLDGEKICTAYAPPIANGLPPVVFAEEAQPRLVPPKRIFCGKLQRSWGFGKHAKVTDVKPISFPKTSKKSRGRVPRIRWFAGSPAFLKYRVKKSTAIDMPYDELDDDDLLAGLSPLTSLDSDSDEEKNPSTEGTELIDFHHSSTPETEFATLH